MSRSKELYLEFKEREFEKIKEAYRTSLTFDEFVETLENDGIHAELDQLSDYWNELDWHYSN